MSKKTINLLMVTGILFIASIVVYLNEHKRGVDFASGSYLIPGMDASMIEKIVIAEAGKELLVLKKEGLKFLLVNHDSFPADMSKVNDLLFKISNIQIAEKISGSKSSFDKLGVDQKKSKKHIVLFGKEEAKVFEIFVGNSKGNGNYIRKDDSQTTYLSSGHLNFGTSKDSFINKNILKLKRDEISGIVATINGNGFIISKDDKNFMLTGPDRADVDQKKVDDYVDAFTNVSFAKYYPARDKQVAGLKFREQFEIKMDAKFSYVVQTLKKEKKFFIKFSAETKDMPKSVKISRDSDQAELAGIDKMLKGQALVKKFNMHHIPWIYEISEGKYGEMKKTIKNFKKK